MEIPGEHSVEKADLLASKLKEALLDKGVKVARPVKYADVRVTGMDESVIVVELTDALARAGTCSPTDLKVAEKKKLVWNGHSLGQMPSCRSQKTNGDRKK